MLKKYQNLQKKEIEHKLKGKLQGMFQGHALKGGRNGVP